ncbi:MAG: enolase C-terminal domain-like protein [Chloroflexota bacterium]
MKIVSVRATVAAVPSRIADAEICAPIDRHARFRHHRASWFGSMEQVVVEVETDEEITGLGLTNGGRAVASLVQDHLSRLIVGEELDDPEVLWDLLYCATLPYGGGGLASMAVSAIDLAVWDILGKAAGQPVFRLLGGSATTRIPCYATGNEPARFAALGFRGVKISMLHGPADGVEGMRANRTIAAKARAELGDQPDLMVDAWMGWDLEYATAMAAELGPYQVRWIEEPLPPHCSASAHAELRTIFGGIDLACGEHQYTHFAFDDLILARAAGVLQPDLCWAGGITEGRRICRAAAAAGISVVPHLGGQPWALHLITAMPDCPLAEWYVGTGPGEELGWAPSLLRGAPAPKDGFISPPDEPGLGISLNTEALERYGLRQ